MGHPATQNLDLGHPPTKFLIWATRPTPTYIIVKFCERSKGWSAARDSIRVESKIA
jgi:hypothetical protein